MVSTVFYYVWNVLSLGLLSAYKVAIRKGHEEALANQENADMHAQARLARREAPATLPAA